MNNVLLSFFSTRILCLVLLCLSQTVDAEQAVRRFDIWEYRIEGNTLLESAIIESAVYPFLGPQKSLKDIEAASKVLQTLYKSNGYPLVEVDIPQQNVIGGIVRLQVTEGKIDRIKISGNEYFSRRNLRKELPAITRGAPFRAASIRQEIDNVNRLNTYRKVVPVLRPGRYPGTMEVELKVKDRLPLAASLEINNRYTAKTSPLRTQVSLGYDNLWLKSHHIALSYQTAPEEPDQVKVWNLSYTMPVGYSSSLVMYGVSSDSEVAAAQDLTVIGNGSVIGVRYLHGLKSSADRVQSLIFGADYKDFGETQQLLGSDAFNVPIEYTGFTLGYNQNIRNDAVVYEWGLSANFGIRGIGNQPQEFENKRFLAIPNYFYFRSNFSRYAPVSDNWSWAYSLRAQLSGSPLISNEQFSAGGVDTVRGYLESSVLADNGWISSVELQRRFKSSYTWLHNASASLFVDGARLRVLDPLPDQTDAYGLLSFGLGFEMQTFKTMQLGLFVAKPVNDLNDSSYDDSTKLHFSLAYHF